MDCRRRFSVVDSMGRRLRTGWRNDPFLIKSLSDLLFGRSFFNALFFS